MAAADPAAVTAETPHRSFVGSPRKECRKPCFFCHGKDAMEKALSARDSTNPQERIKDFLFRLTEGASISNKITHA